MLSRFAQRIRGLSVRWKLLIPFLLFAFCGTSSLTYIGLSSQHDLIKAEERRGLLTQYRAFQNVIGQKKNQALSIATLLAQNPEVQRLLARQHRTALAALLLPLFDQLRENFGVLQFHLHVPPGRSFLRLHLLERYGESLTDRRCIREVYGAHRGMAGIEGGRAGLAIRGIVPILYQNELAGSIEIGFPFNRLLLERLKQQWGKDFTVYEITADGDWRLLSTTLDNRHSAAPHPLPRPRGLAEPHIAIAPDYHPGHGVLFGPIRDYSGALVAAVEIDMNRSAIETRMSRTRNLMILVGAAGLLVSFALTWLVARLLTRPISEIVQEAREIAEGRRESQLRPRPDDEIGMLTRSLNTMLYALQERRRKIQEYARTLESKVQERTADLVASEEKHRTLVESLPLIVYRVLPDGTTEFINSYFTETLQYTVEEVVGNRDFWREKICGLSPDDDFLTACWEDEDEFRAERVILDKQGRQHTFVDRAIPARDLHGRPRWIDGLMIDITEFRRLQQEALRTQELRILGEISARFAHEIRNPVATAGGFARRLRDDLPADGRQREFADIIVQEVVRLEAILKIILSTIQPISLTLGEIDLNALLSGVLRGLEDLTRRRHIRVVPLFADLPHLEGDAKLLSRAFENLLKHALLSAPERDTLRLETTAHEDTLIVLIEHGPAGLAEEDLAQFFLPRLTPGAGSDVPELPLARIIFVRHGGKAEIARTAEDRVGVRVALPIRALGSKQGYAV